MSDLGTRRPVGVWAALTKPEQIAAYMQGSRVTTTWHVGSSITWDGEYDGRSYQDKGKCQVGATPDRAGGLAWQPDRRGGAVSVGACRYPRSRSATRYTRGPPKSGTRPAGLPRASSVSRAATSLASTR